VTRDDASAYRLICGNSSRRFSFRCGASRPRVHSMCTRRVDRRGGHQDVTGDLSAQTQTAIRPVLIGECALPARTSLDRL
jgi:hypothetical protein